MLGVAAFAFTTVWALPNVAGAAFVQVKAIATASPAQNGAVVAIGASAPVRAGSIDVAVEVTNGYPLSVVLGTGRTAFQAAVYRRNSGGRLTRVWQAAVNDPTLEEGSNSPMGGAPGGGAAVVPPGATRHALTDATTSFRLTDTSGAPLAAGVYYLRVWAYGLASPLVPISLDYGLDPLGPPADVPPPGA